MSTTNDKVVRVYLDNDDKSLIQKSNKTQYLFSKNNNENKSTNTSYNNNENGSTKTEKIDLALESISRDCEPSPPVKRYLLHPVFVNKFRSLKL